MEEISIKISHRLRKVVEKTDLEESSNGVVTLEVESNIDGGVSVYIQKKGFGASSAKSVYASFDMDTVRELIAFFNKHLEITEIIKKIPKT